MKRDAELAVAGVVSLVLILASAWWIWPRLTAAKFTHAIRHGDRLAVGRYLHWPGIKQGLEARIQSARGDQELLGYSTRGNGPRLDRSTLEGLDTLEERAEWVIRLMDPAHCAFQRASFLGPLALRVEMETSSLETSPPSVLVFGFEEGGWRLTDLRWPAIEARMTPSPAPLEGASASSMTPARAAESNEIPKGPPVAQVRRQSETFSQEPTSASRPTKPPESRASPPRSGARKSEAELREWREQMKREREARMMDSARSTNDVGESEEFTNKPAPYMVNPMNPGRIRRTQNFGNGGNPMSPTGK